MIAILTQPDALKRGAQAFFQHQPAGGIILMVAAALALVLDNSPLAWVYNSLLQTPVVVQVGALELNKPLLLWINDGLMAVFFFLVGLEIKREVIEGRLSNARQAGLPAAGEEHQAGDRRPRHGDREQGPEQEVRARGGAPVRQQGGRHQGQQGGQAEHDVVRHGAFIIASWPRR